MVGSSEPKIVLLTSDNQEVAMDRNELVWTSKVFQDMLNSCDAGDRVKIDENRETFEAILNVIRGTPLPLTFDTRAGDCWNTYRSVLTVADKYDMRIVMERCEKWLVSRCLRGRVRCSDFKFQDVSEGLQWVLLCQRLGLKDLGWYCAYDLGSQLAEGFWREGAAEFLKEVSDAELLKVMLEAVFDYKQSHGQNVATDESTSQGVLQAPIVPPAAGAPIPAQDALLFQAEGFFDDDPALP